MRQFRQCVRSQAVQTFGRGCVNRIPQAGQSTVSIKNASIAPLAVLFRRGNRTGPQPPETPGPLPEEYHFHSLHNPHRCPAARVIEGAPLMVVAPLTSNFGRVAGKRFTVAAFPWRWEGADGCIVLPSGFPQAGIAGKRRIRRRKLKKVPANSRKLQTGSPPPGVTRPLAPGDPSASEIIIGPFKGLAATGNSQ